VLPSPRLRHRVHGSTDPAGYLRVGRECWNDIERLLADSGTPASEFRDILDFGCGSGRVVRNIPLTGSRIGRVWGVDIDRSAIRWCARHLPGYRFDATPHLPPTPFADASFDLIFAVSVFTHLDEDMQFAWLGELRRLLRPSGRLVVSVHGAYHRSLQPRTYALRDGFQFTTLRKGLFKKDGLPSFYQDAQHSRAYIEKRWSTLFTVVSYVERGIARHHDAVVLAPKGA
jgi:SAM-dependent methyltransferase